MVSEDILGAETPFTIHEPAGSQLVVDFLVGLGYTVARTWTTSPTYRFELGVTAQDRSSEFLWSTSQLERVSDACMFPVLNQARLNKSLDA